MQADRIAVQRLDPRPSPRRPEQQVTAGLGDPQQKRKPGILIRVDRNQQLRHTPESAGPQNPSNQPHAWSQFEPSPRGHFKLTSPELAAAVATNHAPGDLAAACHCTIERLGVQAGFHPGVDAIADDPVGEH